MSLESELGYDSWSPADPAPCDNCGDGCGWHHEQMRTPEGKPHMVWFACADCNDDEVKPKPEVCEECGRREEICICPKERYGFNDEEIR